MGYGVPACRFHPNRGQIGWPRYALPPPGWPDLQPTLSAGVVADTTSLDRCLEICFRSLKFRSKTNTQFIIQTFLFWNTNKKTPRGPRWRHVAEYWVFFYLAGQSKYFISEIYLSKHSVQYSRECDGSSSSNKLDKHDTYRRPNDYETMPQIKRIQNHGN